MGCSVHRLRGFNSLCPPLCSPTVWPPGMPQSGLRIKVQLLWVHISSPLVSLLFGAVLREVCRYLPSHPPFLLFLSPVSLCIVDLIVLKSRSVKLSSLISIEPGGRHTVVSENAVLYCGGETSVSARCAWHITMSGVAEELPEMIRGHSFHGMTSYNARVFVLGGENRLSEESSGRYCEELELATGVWRPLPLLGFKRWLFTPCEWRKDIYLCGGGVAEIEVLSPAANTVRVVGSLPFTYEAVAFVCGEELVVMGKCDLVVLRQAHTEVKLRHQRVTNMLRAGAGYLQCPVVYLGKVYFASSSDLKVFAFDLQTGGVDWVDVSFLKPKKVLLG